MDINVVKIVNGMKILIEIFLSDSRKIVEGHEVTLVKDQCRSDIVFSENMIECG